MIRQEDVYEVLNSGLSIIPVRPHSKKPAVGSWQEKSPTEQWAEAFGKGSVFNCGLKAGDGVAVLDCDNELTKRWALEELSKYDPYMQETPSGGLHVVFRYEGDPAQAYYRLQPPYDGELRVGSGSYTLLAPSKISKLRYEEVSGGLDSLPTIPLGTFDPLQKRRPSKVDSPFKDIIVPLHKMELSDDIMKRILWLSRAKKGEGYTEGDRTYSSRSELEMSVVRSLVVFGRTFDEIHDLFSEYRCGHFMEQDSPRTYLYSTWRKVIQSVTSMPVVDAIQRKWLEIEEADVEVGTEVILKILLSKALQFKTDCISLTKSTVIGISGMGHRNTVTKYLDKVCAEHGVSFYRDGKYTVYDLSFFLRSERAVRQDNTYELKRSKDAIHLEEHVGVLWELKKKSRVLEYLEEVGQCTAKEASQATETPLETTYDAMNVLIEAEIVEKEGLYYRLTGKIPFVQLHIREKLAKAVEKCRKEYARYAAWLEEKIDDMERYRALRTLNSFINAKQRLRTA